MISLLDYEIDRLIEEDFISIDLTSHLLGVGGQKGIIEIFSRDGGIVSGSEEVVRIFNKFNIEVGKYIRSGSRINKGDVLISGTGNSGDLHKVWKVSQNILDYCSGIATKTNRMLNKARENNPNISLLTTRKSFPGTRKLAIKSIVAGGALPHRLNISETILVFKNHMNIIGGFKEFLGKVDAIKREACEKKLIVECDNIMDARRLAEAGVDGIQFDKLLEIDNLEKLKIDYPNITILLAGGINEDNVDKFSRSFIDGIVTTSLYTAKPLDLGTRIDIV